ncbi:aspartate kinase [Pseudoalteromonas sp. J010]|uniref:aspartate kinase n=1 Tax=Pseudoalteromonas sp. J010 TaxID=998465 RepID=UPI000F64DFAD|nr:aspartate kinase [Pseudoalteromonas sp. J010]RRS08741.1 aspartate kinase [Pseudoalteromonas sp. J010]
MSALKVAKFGGTSVASFESILQCANIVKNDKSVKVVVVSAQAGITEKLVALTRSRSLEHISLIHSEITQFYENFTLPMYGLPLQQVCNEAISIWLEQLARKASRFFHTRNNSDYHTIISMGEIISSKLVSMIFASCRLQNQERSALELISVSGDEYDDYQVDIALCTQACQQQLELLPSEQLIVTQGFIAKHIETDELVTLGRGGSDFSAAIIAQASQATELQIWTDVEGVYSGDPRIIADTFAIEELSYRATAMLANLGAKVLHRKSIEPAMQGCIPIKVASTFKPSGKHTLIHNINEPTGAYSVTYLNNVSLLTINQSGLAELTRIQLLLALITQLGLHFQVCELHANSIVLITQNMDEARLNEIDQYLISNGFEDILIQCEQDLSLASIVGSQLNQANRFTTYVTNLLDEHPVIRTFGLGHESVMSFVVEPQHLLALLQELHLAIAKESVTQL